jgi:hypothetical protein
MSHVVEIELQVKFTDRKTLDAACQRLGLAAPEHKLVQLYSEKAEGLAVELPGWRFPIVVDLKKETVKYDNFNGRWGRIEELTRLEQAYQTEHVLKTARDSCMFSSINETILEDGSIQINLMAY